MKSPFPAFSKQAKDLKLGIYRHFKGEEYCLLFVAHNTEDEKEYAVYQSVKKGYYAVRPLKMFLDTIDRAGYKGPRFTYVGKKSI